MPLVGPTTVSGGTLVLGKNNALGSTSSVTVAGGGALNFAAAGGINLAATIPFFIIGAGPGGNGAIESLGGANSIAGPITATLPATIGADGGTLTLSNPNLTVTQGVITFTGAGNILLDSAMATPYGPGSPGLLETQGPGNLDLAAIGDIATYGWDTVLYPFMGETSGNDGPLLPVSQHTWATNDTWFYQGQINVPNYNNTGTGYLSFAKSIDDSTLLMIDGVTYINDPSYTNSIGTGEITLTAGWHNIDIRVANGGGGAGADALNNNGWTGFTNTKGFVFRIDNGPNDPLGNTTTKGNVANYTVPTDSGSGNLFRVAPSGLVKNGAGTLTLNGADPYTGPTTINGGTIVVANANGLLGTSGVTVANGSSLELAATGGINLAASIPIAIAGNGPSGAGAIENLGGINSIAGAITLTGAATIGSAAGTLTINNASLNAGAGLLTFAGAGSCVVSSSISGTAAGLTKTGSGTVTLAGNNNSFQSGPTVVNGGSLLVDGTLLNSSVTVGPNGFLGGTGVINQGVTAHGGTIDPGNATSTGTLTTLGVSMASAATFAVELGGTAANQFDQLGITAGGTVNLNSDSGSGAKLTVALVNNFTPSLGQTFPIINNQGSPVSGTFNGLAEGDTFLVSHYIFDITYQGGTGDNSVVLTVLSLTSPVAPGSDRDRRQRSLLRRRHLCRDSRGPGPGRRPGKRQLHHNLQRFGRTAGQCRNLHRDRDLHQQRPDLHQQLGQRHPHHQPRCPLRSRQRPTQRPTMRRSSRRRCRRCPVSWATTR